jgi:hypothetical protein
MLQRIVLTASLVGALVFAATALAGNGAGSNKSSSSISAPVMVSTATTTGAAAVNPSFGDTITFNVSTTQTGNPFVNLNCYQNGALVAQDWAAFWPSSENFILSSPAWTSGAADCTANLDMYVNSTKYKVLASTSFHVDA